MIKVIQSYQVQGSVIAIHTDPDFIYFADTGGGIHTVCKALWNLESQSVTHADHSPLHPYQKGASFSRGGHIGYSKKEGEHSALCLRLSADASERDEEKKDPVWFKAHDERSEVIAFCGQKGQYILSGGTDGRIYMFNSESGKLLMSLKPKPDYISCITTDSAGRNLLYAAYDKSLTVLNIRHQKQRLYTILDDVVQDAFFYNNSGSFYAVAREGNSYLYDLKSGDVSQKALFPSWPTCCVHDSSGRYVIVGTRNGSIHIVRLSDHTLFSSFTLDQKGIAALHIDHSNLLIGFENGWIYIVDMDAHIDDFSQALAVKNYKTAKKCLDGNLFLSIHPMSEMFQEAWEDALKEIVNQFSTGNAAAALDFAAPFLSDENHKKELDFLLQKRKDFEKFALLVQNKEFFEAFGMLEKAPYLSKTDSARKLELYFTKSIAESKKLLAADTVLNIPKVKELLKPFENIPAKKEIIRLLMKHHHIFLEADALIKEKKLKDYFTLVAQYPFLTAEEMYEKVCALGEASIKKLKMLVQDGRYDDAISGIKQVAVFLPLRTQLIEMETEIRLRQKLLELVRADDMCSVYKLVASHPVLESMQEFKTYDETFDNTLSKAMLAVERGEIKQVQQILLPYSSIDVFRPKIKECVRQASYNKLSSLLIADSLAAAKTIASYYVNEFGKDDEYTQLLKLHGLNQ